MKGKLGGLFRSVAARIAVIAVGPLVGLALTVGVSFHADGKRKASEMEFGALSRRLTQVESFRSQLAMLNFQISGFLESRAPETAVSIRQGIEEARSLAEGFRFIEDDRVKAIQKELSAQLDELKTSFEALDQKVEQVGRNSQNGIIALLDRETEMTLALFEGVVSLDERFRPLLAAYVDYRGTELRFRWMRDPKLENRIEFMRTALLTQLGRATFDLEQVKILRGAIDRQGNAFAEWKQGVQEETYVRNNAAAAASIARETADKLHQRANALMEAERTHNAEVSSSASHLSLMAAILAAALAVALIAWIGRELSQALARLSAAMGRVAGGEADVSIPALGRKDEIGAMARALEVFQASITERAALAQQSQRDQQERLERGQRVEASISSFAATINAALSSLKGSAEKMDNASASLDRDSGILADQSGLAGQATAAAAGEVNSVAASAAQLTASVHEVSHQAVRSTQVANNAVEQSRRASELMASLVAEASRIGDVVALIRSITEQTNLLALNATIEAARAGDAGKGFAIVAQEVKALAGQTARATEEIAGKVGAIQHASADAGEAIGAIDHILGEMSAIATSVAAAVEEQSSAINAISENVNVAARNAMEGADAIRATEERARAGRSTAGEVGMAARAVADETTDIEMHIGRFLQQVRA